MTHLLHLRRSDFQWLTGRLSLGPLHLGFVQRCVVAKLLGLGNTRNKFALVVLGDSEMSIFSFVAEVLLAISMRTLAKQAC
jgi:hypothetical protein